MHNVWFNSFFNRSSFLSIVFSADPKYFQQFFNGPKAGSTVTQPVISFFNRPEAFSTAFSTDPHLFSTAFQQPQNHFQRFSTDPKLFQQIFNRLKVFLTVFF
jgi:hypothetical protein